ncbi:MAG TPA: TerB N-terminal domain-containing protein, partial [Longimicrobium sp.]|nr:TerB N-terminal domain-containing protein [Longimicrobium sp.]
PAPAPAPARGVPPGEAVVFAGQHLPGGLLYVGTGLASVSGVREAEPALLDPRRPISFDPAEAAYAIAPYWPSYSSVSAAFRAKYLRWLAGGRRDPDGDVSCVFLFFYGIERRVLVDAESDPRAAAEVPALLAEVERLLGIYGDNGSFRGYAGGLLEFARVRHGLARLEGDAAVEPAGATWMQVRVAVGRFAVEGTPVPADWALAWLRSSGQWYPRTAAQRCPEEFEAAFRLRYRERFGDGMVLKPNKKRLALEYVPASASFAGQTYRLSFGDLPDVGALTAPVDRLKQVAEAATEAIDKYSRFVGRSGDGNSLAALGLLPPEVLRKKVRREPPPLVAEVASALRPEGRGLIGSDTLVHHWPSAKADRLTRKEAEGVAEFLEKLGIGMAPDARHTGINLSQASTAALFLLPSRAPEPGPDFASATLMLTLAAAVAGSDEIARQEEEQIERHLESAYRLNDADRARLRGHLDWLRACPPSTTGLKKQLEPLAPETRRQMARALIAIAGADGHVSPAEVKMLARLYPLLGLDAQQVYADVHALAAGTPATVLPAEPARDFAIPRPAAEPARSGFTLDTSRIAAIQSETHEVTRVLASVFADPEPASASLEPAGVAVLAPDEEADAEDPLAPAAGTLPGLDAAHSALVRALGDRGEIGAAEFAALAEAQGLMAGGAMES